MVKPKTNRIGDTKKVSGYDVCQTPPHALEPLLPLIPKDWLIWESAHGPEFLLADALISNGYNVTMSDLADGEHYNFFTFQPNHWTMQVTNPPWSIKYEWIEHSFELDRPFALLVPYETTFAAKFRNIATRYHNRPWSVDVLIPERRINFKMPNTGWGIVEWSEEKQAYVKRGESAQMPVAWVTWGLNAYTVYPSYMDMYAVPMRSVRYDVDNKPKDR